MTSRASQLVTQPQFEIRFDAVAPRLSCEGSHCLLELPSPLLGGTNIETYSMEQGQSRWLRENLLLLENETQTFGAAILPCRSSFQQDISELYLSVLTYISEKQLKLHRIWNFVPQINSCHSGLEKYREFNLGRWKAFEQTHGANAYQHMPAASAVGLNGSHFVLFFVAGLQPPLYLENPSQVPAYRYPQDYGPKPPGFARATLVDYQDETWGYLSGTASISGHQTIGEGNWRKQFEVTMSNIQTMLGKMNMSLFTSHDSPLTQLRDWRCYLRHPEMYPLVREWLVSEYKLPLDKIAFQLADICRQDLDLEFEATLVRKNTL